MASVRRQAAVRSVKRLAAIVLVLALGACADTKQLTQTLQDLNRTLGTLIVLGK